MKGDKFSRLSWKKRRSDPSMLEFKENVQSIFDKDSPHTYLD